jgi:protein-tyrosine phosphatase
MKHILVVCEGNICRSPMAQGVLASALPQAQVRSAGIHALSGMPADPTAVRLMQLRGIDITKHRAVQLTRFLCLDTDLVLVMSSEQRKSVEEEYPVSRGRVFRLGEFNELDVPDPYRQDERVFKEVLQLIEDSAREWLKRIAKF